MSIEQRLTESYIARNRHEYLMVLVVLMGHAFHVEPLPNDKYRFDFKPGEDLARKITIAVSTNPRRKTFNRRVLDIEVCTYNGTYYEDEEKPPGIQEYGGPYVPVSINYTHGLDITLGNKPNKKTAPRVLIEHQSDRWLIAISREGDGDLTVLNEILDDGRIVVQPESRMRDPLTTIDPVGDDADEATKERIEPKNLKYKFKAPCHPYPHCYPTVCPKCKSDLTSEESVFVKIGKDDREELSNLDDDGFVLEPQDTGNEQPIAHGQHAGTFCAKTGCSERLDQYEILD